MRGGGGGEPDGSGIGEPPGRAGGEPDAAGFGRGGGGAPGGGAAETDARLQHIAPIRARAAIERLRGAGTGFMGTVVILLAAIVPSPRRGPL